MRLSGCNWRSSRSRKEATSRVERARIILSIEFWLRGLDARIDDGAAAA
jgi:hypothetical protein